MDFENLYFDDLKIGTKIVSPTRTITETDLVNFAAYTADYNLIHTDEEYSKKTMAGTRMAHGLIGTSYAIGLHTRTIFNQQLSKAVIAFYGIKEWKYLKPILIGDTIHSVLEIIELQDTKPDRGIMISQREVINQRGEVTQRGITASLLAKRPK